MDKGREIVDFTAKTRVVLAAVGAMISLLRGGVTTQRDSRSFRCSRRDGTPEIRPAARWQSKYVTARV